MARYILTYGGADGLRVDARREETGGHHHVFVLVWLLPSRSGRPRQRCSMLNKIHSSTERMFSSMYPWRNVHTLHTIPPKFPCARENGLKDKCYSLHSVRLLILGPKQKPRRKLHRRRLRETVSRASGASDCSHEHRIQVE